MLNSSLIFLNSYNKNKVWSVLSLFLWIGYMLINQKNMGLIFSVVNILVFVIVVCSIHYVKNRTANMILSVFSIFFWSILIDVVTYLIYPEFANGMAISNYIVNGIIFNSKYIFSNIAILLVVEIATVIFSSIKNIMLNKTKRIINNIN